MSRNSKRWQAPGNAKIFDNELGSNSYMNNRTICILKYLKDNPKIIVEDYKTNIKEYLKSCADYEDNKSLETHFC